MVEVLTEQGSTILTEVAKVVIVVEMKWPYFCLKMPGFSKSKCCYRFKNAARRKRWSW